MQTETLIRKAKLLDIRASKNSKISLRSQYKNGKVGKGKTTAEVKQIIAELTFEIDNLTDEENALSNK